MNARVDHLCRCKGIRRERDTPKCVRAISRNQPNGANTHTHTPTERDERTHTNTSVLALSSKNRTRIYQSAHAMPMCARVCVCVRERISIHLHWVGTVLLVLPACDYYSHCVVVVAVVVSQIHTIEPTSYFILSCVTAVRSLSHIDIEFLLVGIRTITKTEKSVNSCSTFVHLAKKTSEKI